MPLNAADVVADLEASGDPIPEPITERRFSGKFNVRVPESLHRELALSAAEGGVSLNRLVSDRLATRTTARANHRTKRRCPSKADRLAPIEAVGQAPATNLTKYAA